MISDTVRGSARLVLCGILFAVTALLIGCTPIAGSYAVSGPNAAVQERAVSGENYYYLPKVTLTAMVEQNERGLVLTVTSPRYKADAASGVYALSYQPSGVSEDSIKEFVSDERLLRTVRTSATDKTWKVLPQIVKATPTKESSVVAGNVVLLAWEFDPADKTQVETASERVSAAISGLAERECRAALRFALGTKKPGGSKAQEAAKTIEADTKQTNLFCQAEQRLKTSRQVINFEVVYNPFKKDKAVVPPCSIGVCTRVQAPASITATVGGSPVVRNTFMMPNDSDPLPIELRREAFATVSQALIFKDGIVVGSDLNKNHSVEGMTKIITGTVGWVLDSISSILLLKIDTTPGNDELQKANQRNEQLKDENAKLQEQVNNPDPAPSLNLFSLVIPGYGAGSGFEWKSNADTSKQAENSVTVRAGGGKDEKKPDGKTPDFGGPLTRGSNG